ncbi:MAG: DUF309 domain-containing protein [bacterium]
MSKHDRIAAFVKSLPSLGNDELHPCYAGYFECFNREDYYEAHDVLEHLWLECRDENHLFYKGLIQLAGAFVHLKKQFERPEHPTDGRRLHPAARLLALSVKNISPFGPVHMGLPIGDVCELGSGLKEKIRSSEFLVNPWRPGAGPRLELQKSIR